MKNDTFQQLITLLQLFNGNPELLAQKLLQFNCLHPDFLRRINENQTLQEYTSNENLLNNKPYFKSLNELHAYYDRFFIENKIVEVKQLPAAKNPSDVLQQQLEKAVHFENYELAAQIKKYMILVGISPKDF
jgi:hypothetical protein